MTRYAAFALAAALLALLGCSPPPRLPPPSVRHELAELDRVLMVLPAARATEAYAIALVRVHRGAR
jgi:hypothetical protein